MKGRRLLIETVLLVLVFLIGFVPQYLKARTLTQQLNSYESSRQLCEARDLLGMVYLETSQKNYGLAGQYSTRLFADVQGLIDKVGDPKNHEVFQDILSQRDAISGALARGDASAYLILQSLYEKMLEASRSF